ncbi:outer membrane protein assembly factor BamB family protein [Sphingobacterium pedocola]|uniref:Metallophosphoesterase n=1 Tax=Sphingobacterium pedocola TaxID=2082722 RepID=A0ABR9TCF1_9SPHI|nr:PQQ-binding-like beta-propeller repeat protein [Sphingobacterium pedocola]MBE8722727.1 metallophosphoesterase [Sphingobacterium pedocola]
MKYFFRLLIVFGCCQSLSFAQSFKFAQVTDTHVGGGTGADDLRRTVKDLNQLKDIDFVILSGDVTEFGSDEELAIAKRILDSLNLPLYVIPGNHDSNWSESGANSFRKVFGAESFFFEHKGVQFIGTTSGPNMRMSPGQIPRENLVWMDSVFKANPDKETPLIAINHYPLDSSLNNWFEKIDRLKQRNIQVATCGHGHQNRLYDWEGIPGVMVRSNLRAKEKVGGYNIITIQPDSIFFQTRRPLLSTEDYWLKLPLKKFQDVSGQAVKRPDYSVNSKSKAKLLWEYQDHGDIGAGITSDGKLLFTANTVGEVYALSLADGKKIWSYKTGGKVYSTPAVEKGIVVVGSSDHFIYGLDAKTGTVRWKTETSKAVLGSPQLYKGKAYIGGSDGFFRCLDLLTGNEVWKFEGVKGYVSTLPTIADNKVIFGSWGNGFYALDVNTGQLVWEWNNGHGNRMLSAAACYPVVVNNRMFIVAPDRYMTALDLKTGKQIWRAKQEQHRVRESMGLSRDKRNIYVKTMDGELLGVSAKADTMVIDWKSSLQLPYDIVPTAIYSSPTLAFVPSNSGLLSAVQHTSGEVAWQYKISNAMINPPLVLKNKVAVSTMDGKIVLLQY